MRSRFVRLIVLAAMVSGLLVAFQGPAGSATTTIKATSTFKWNPGFKHIIKGTKVIWRNPTNIRHRVDAYGANWDKFATLAPNGGSTSKIFGKTGVYKYRCSLPGHSTLESGVCTGMCGKVHVTVS